MGIEQSFERIANSLEKSAAVLEELLEISRWNKARLEGKAAVADAPAEAEKSSVSSPEPEAPTMDYDTLKAELKARGISIPKGTKMTTLQKLWAKHQDDPYIVDPNQGSEPVGWEPVVPEAPTEVPAEAPVEAPAAEAAPTDDLFDDAPSPAAEPEKKPMTAEEARKVLTEGFKGTPEEKQMLLTAFAAVGATHFKDIKEGDFEKVVETFKALKAGAKNE